MEDGTWTRFLFFLTFCFFVDSHTHKTYMSVHIIPSHLVSYPLVWIAFVPGVRYSLLRGGNGRGPFPFCECGGGCSPHARSHHMIDSWRIVVERLYGEGLVSLVDVVR